MKAVLITDMHACPKAEGAKPHVGGPVVGPPDSDRLFVAGLAVALVGDRIVCVGPPDEIVEGVAGVFVGGRLLAHGSAKTSHGGTIIATGALELC